MDDNYRDRPFFLRKPPILVQLWRWNLKWEDPCSSSILKGCAIMNQPFWGTYILGDHQICPSLYTAIEHWNPWWLGDPLKMESISRNGVALLFHEHLNHYWVSSFVKTNRWVSALCVVFPSMILRQIQSLCCSSSPARFQGLTKKGTKQFHFCCRKKAVFVKSLVPKWCQ